MTTYKITAFDDAGCTYYLKCLPKRLVVKKRFGGCKEGDEFTLGTQRYQIKCACHERCPVMIGEEERPVYRREKLLLHPMDNVLNLIADGFLEAHMV